MLRLQAKAPSISYMSLSLISSMDVFGVHDSLSRLLSPLLTTCHMSYSRLPITPGKRAMPCHLCHWVVISRTPCRSRALSSANNVVAEPSWFTALTSESMLYHSVTHVLARTAVCPFVTCFALPVCFGTAFLYFVFDNSVP